MHKSRGTLFLTLKIFSATGGIEKICRAAGKALFELEGDKARIFSLHDSDASVSSKYFPAGIFKIFNGNKIRFILSSFREGANNKIVILSHINLLLVGFLVKFFSPKTRLVMYAHGIEVWNHLPAWKIMMLKKCDKIFAVSTYTKERIKELYKLDNCEVLNNCLDPFISEPAIKDDVNLFEKYNLSETDFIIMTVTRIAADERYKGHDKVLEAVSALRVEFPNLRYLIAGKYDQSEKERLDNLVKKFNIKGKVIFTGYIPDNALRAHYQLADAFVMPSTGEGFGIVFIEAMYYGLPVVAGKDDGSVDALCNGKLGLLVDPLDVEDIAAAVKKIITAEKDKYKPDFNLLMENFSFQTYKENLHKQLKKIEN